MKSLHHSHWITLSLFCSAALLAGCFDQHSSVDRDEAELSDKTVLNASRPTDLVATSAADRRSPAEPLEYDPADLEIEPLLVHVQARAHDWRPDAVLTVIDFQTGADGKADLTRNPASLLFSFFSPSAEASMLIVPTRLGDLALVPSPFVEGHHRIGLPDRFATQAEVLKQAHSDGFKGKAYRAFLYSLIGAEGATSCSWSIAYNGHRGTHTKPLIYDGVTGKPIPPELPAANADTIAHR